MCWPAAVPGKHRAQRLTLSIVLSLDPHSDHSETEGAQVQALYFAACLKCQEWKDGSASEVLAQHDSVCLQPQLRGSRHRGTWDSLARQSSGID